ncbi:MAG: D-alanyl-D-alanine carboxypeptidase [Oscillospiraceae bacterium]|nr:D-alanyl-D-alanine carboxypeptidase [Oscillospiraceae bacterium]
MKRLLIVLLCLCLLSPPALAVTLRRDDDITLSAPSAILMERSTGTVLYEKNADARLSPASVTKVMTMLLVAEAVDRGELGLEDRVTASARAASMGGSQIWLEEGESMSVGEMLKCVAVVSANDCCVALAEHLAGSEEAFAARMNQRASELGMANSHFLSCSGLTDSDEHYTSARDIALMSRELLNHPWIRDYTTVWMDTIRGGDFGLSNTNKLIYYYPGATGLKTGFTSKAMYCLSASAERDGVEYIAVVLHCASSAERFESAKTLLSYGFANYTLLSAVGEEPIPSVRVLLGQSERVQPVPEPGANLLVEKGGPGGKLRWELELPEEVSAPVEAGARLGCIRLYRGDELLRETALLAAEGVGKLGVLQIAGRLLTALVADAPAPEGEDPEPETEEGADWGLKKPENGNTIQ